ncbi:MAG: hypothetical protein LBQ78_06245 [Tannerellaceae bacterium]|nr:hypothetical protein [Tannerellaceae bacterium]
MAMKEENVEIGIPVLEVKIGKGKTTIVRSKKRVKIEDNKEEIVTDLSEILVRKLEYTKLRIVDPKVMGTQIGHPE